MLEPSDSLDMVAQSIAEEIISAPGLPNPTKTPIDFTDLGTILDVVKECLLTASKSSNSNHRPAWMPDGVGCEDQDTLTHPQHYITWRWIAVGYFREARRVGQPHDIDSRYCPPGFAPDRSGQSGGIIPDGQNVQVRTVAGGGPRMAFGMVVVTSAGNRTSSGETYAPIELEKLLSVCTITAGTVGNPNFAMCERCYHYLKYWLFTDDLPAPTLPFVGELYEIVNSQRDPESLACVSFLTTVMNVSDNTTILLPLISRPSPSVR